ncbi:RHS repeat domain-containing protein, partial [Pectobacterium aquaticum]|uniref:RHS repeat domain-containing protein n=1 Tax=Pectobacterium aquaticum TaxID=2204145 RepID=UPI0023EE3322
YEPGSFRPLAQVEAQGDSTQLHYIVTDLTGTARELCSEEGEIRWRGEQGLWGAHREERRPIPLRRYLGDAANEEVYCELRYQGQLYDAETGLYYNRHRYYDAESGQYLSPDPIGLRGGIRPQAYVHNPLEWVDPFGLEKKGPHDPKLTKDRIKDYLSDVKSVPREQLIEDLKSSGLKVKGQSPDGRFVEFVDKSGNVRAKIHPADKVTKYEHLHLYDKKGNPLDVNLNRVDYRSPDAHIGIRPLNK